jgi:hypothetical protein
MMKFEKCTWRIGDGSVIRFFAGFGALAASLAAASSAIS